MTSGTVSPPKSPEPLRVMTFGEHLEELRSRLLRALLLTGIGTIVALCYQDSLMEVVSGPHREAMSRVVVRQQAARSARDLVSLAERLSAFAPEVGRSVYAEHLQVQALRQGAEELGDSLRGVLGPAATQLLLEQLSAGRRLAERSVYYERMQRACAQVSALEERLDSFPHASQEPLQEVVESIGKVSAVLEAWKEPGTTLSRVPWPELERRLHELEGARNKLIGLENWRQFRPKLKVLSYPEPFFANIKICLLAGLLLGLPWITLELWGFISAGLYKSERRAVYPFIPMSFVFFAAGVSFAYFVLVPVGLAYLGGYGSPEIIEGDFTLRAYISLIMTMLLGMGLVFQLPLFMIFLSRAGIVSTAQFRQYRKISIFGAAVVGAMLTPPDPVTQLLMALPLVLLYETGIWASVLLAKKARPVEE